MLCRYVIAALAVLIVPQSLSAEILTFYSALFQITHEEDYVTWANRTSGVYRFVRPFGPFHSARFFTAHAGDETVVQMRTVTNGVDNATKAIDNLVDEIGECLKPFYSKIEFEDVATNDINVCIFKRSVDCRQNVLSVGAKKNRNCAECLLFCELKPSSQMPTGLEDPMLTRDAVMSVLRKESIGPFVFTNAAPSEVLLGISQACVGKIMLCTGMDMESYISLCTTNNLSFYCPSTNCISALLLIANRLNLNLEIDDAIHLSPKEIRFNAKSAIMSPQSDQP